jgi:hypothetical protein
MNGNGFGIGESDGRADVDTPSPEFTAMVDRWELIDTLLGGTPAMRAAGRKYLPQEPKEDDETYRVRVARAILFAGYEDAVERVTAKPFSKPITIENEEALPGRTKAIPDNSDMTGRDITQLSRDVFADAINHGLTHLVVDFDENGAGDAGEERARGLHPYFTHVKARQLFAWKWKRVDGRNELSQVRISESRSEEVGNYGEIRVPHVRVINAPVRVENEDGSIVESPGTWELHRRDPKTGDFELVNSGMYTFPQIPIVTFYTERTGFMTARPPLEKLAWANLAHWQSYADQRHLLRFARFAILFLSGLSEEEMEKPISLGPAALFRSTNEKAKMAFVEHTGKGAEIGRMDLKEIEDWMEVLGMRPFTESTSSATATSRTIGEDGANADIKLWVRGLENFLNEAFKFAALWDGEEMPDGVRVRVFDDFAVGVRAAEDVKAITALREKRIITAVTAISELKRRGLLSDGVVPEEEAQAVLDEGPDLPTFGGGDDEDEDGDKDDGPVFDTGA